MRKILFYFCIAFVGQTFMGCDDSDKIDDWFEEKSKIMNQVPEYVVESISKRTSYPYSYYDVTIRLKSGIREYGYCVVSGDKSILSSVTYDNFSEWKDYYDGGYDVFKIAELAPGATYYYKVILSGNYPQTGVGVSTEYKKESAIKSFTTPSE